MNHHHHHPSLWLGETRAKETSLMYLCTLGRANFHEGGWKFLLSSEHPSLFVNVGGCSVQACVETLRHMINVDVDF